MRAISASELVAFTRCGHSARLSATGVTAQGSSEDAVLLQKKGHEHEQRVLNSLKGCVEIRRRDPRSTRLAMEEGHPWIYHAYFADGDLVGEPDFLRRVEAPSALGAYSYEPFDAKLGRALKPEYVIQLCHYGELVSRVQGRVPDTAGILSAGERVFEVQLRDYLDYYRNLLGSYRKFMREMPSTEAYPVDYCSYCGFKDRCVSEWENGDHLSRVLGMRRNQVAVLAKMGIGTRAALAAAEAGSFRREKGMTKEGFEKLVRQARAQISGTWEYLNRTALAVLPEPGTGDLFFDMESDPHVGTAGLEYLFGFWVREGTSFRFEKFWAHTVEEEKAALQAVVDFMVSFRERHPGMHVYHYHSYEPNHMVDLTSRHGICEEKLDDLLRNEIFVDLFPLVSRALIVPTATRSLKAIEPLMGFERQGELKAAVGSIVYYERWIETGEARWLDDIEQYNREDVRATAALYDWLRRLR